MQYTLPLFKPRLFVDSRTIPVSPWHLALLANDRPSSHHRANSYDEREFEPDSDFSESSFLSWSSADSVSSWEELGHRFLRRHPSKSRVYRGHGFDTYHTPYHGSNGSWRGQPFSQDFSGQDPYSHRSSPLPEHSAWQDQFYDDDTGLTNLEILAPPPDINNQESNVRPLDVGDVQNGALIMDIPEGATLSEHAHSVNSQEAQIGQPEYLQDVLSYVDDGASLHSGTHSAIASSMWSCSCSSCTDDDGYEASDSTGSTLSTSESGYRDPVGDGYWGEERVRRWRDGLV